MTSFLSCSMVATVWLSLVLMFSEAWLCVPGEISSFSV